MLKAAWVFHLKTKHLEDVKNCVLTATDFTADKDPDKETN